VQSFFGWAFAFALVAMAGLSAGTRPARGPGQEAPTQNYTGISVQSSPQVFATMCALDAAGFDADESTLAEMPDRLKLRADLLKMQGPATTALRQFYRQHAFANRAETLSRYITFSLVVGPPPEFKFLYDRDLLPPDVLTIEDFQGILANFYHEAGLAARWGEVEQEYERARALYDAPVRHIVTISNAYLREVVQTSHGRTFTVYVEPLVGNLENFRIYGNTYSIVVGTPSPLPLDDIQHAYLHFLLDPLPLQYRNQVDTKRALLTIAARAPRLPLDYQDDFVSFTDECLIRAVELRLQKLTPAQLEADLRQQDESGFILVRPLVEQLMKFEKEAPSMQYYFPDLIAGIDVAAEQKRLQNMKFAAAQASPAPEHGSFEPARELDNPHLLEQGERDIALKEPEEAKAAFQKVLARSPNDPRALYGMALASVLDRDADTAKTFFERVIVASSPTESAPAVNGNGVDPSLIAWSHVYLGRIFDLEDDRDSAITEYQAALAVVGAPESARVAAQQGVKSAYQPSAPANQKPQ
jgi:tetratricopeptide (TPR) repeat protein